MICGSLDNNGIRRAPQAEWERIYKMPRFGQDCNRPYN